MNSEKLFGPWLTGDVRIEDITATVGGILTIGDQRWEFADYSDGGAAIERVCAFRLISALPSMAIREILPALIDIYSDYLRPPQIVAATSKVLSKGNVVRISQRADLGLEA